MRRSPVALSCLLATPLLLVGCSAAGGGGALPSTQVPLGTRTLREPLGATSLVGNEGVSGPESLCAASADPNRASCLASIRVATSTTATSSSPIGGLRPSDLANLYGYPPPGLQRPTWQTVGIVVVGDYGAAESDLAVYRAQFDLPPCTSASGCLRKVGAAAPAATSGSSGAPTSVSANPTNPQALGWAAETDADTEAVSAVCANCKIVIAEAASDRFGDLGSAVASAVGAGATIVDASFGAPESSAQKQYESLFEPGDVKVVAAAGDSGPGVFFPAAATNVVAVAGTTVHSLGMVAFESLWSQSGGGCSRKFAKPAWQFSITCSQRSVADVAAVGDPNSGLASYDRSYGGWGISGGTSVSAPIIAAMWALSGDTGALDGAQRLYQRPFNFLNVVSGGSFSGLGVPYSLNGF